MEDGGVREAVEPAVIVITPSASSPSSDDDDDGETSLSKSERIVKNIKDISALLSSTSSQSRKLDGNTIHFSSNAVALLTH